MTEHSGRSVKTTIPEINNEIFDVVLDDTSSKVCEIASLWASQVNGYIIFSTYI